MKEDGEERLPPTVLRAELSRLKMKEPRINDAIPPDTCFKSHLEIVVSLLKKISSARNVENNLLQSVENVMINENSQNSDILICELHQYVVRSCLQKIITRAGYHSNIKGGRVSVKCDFASFLKPSEGWKATHNRLARNYSDKFVQAKYISTLLSWISGSSSEIDTWSDSEWDDMSGFDAEKVEKLKSYTPGATEVNCSSYCFQLYGTPVLTGNPGAYLRPGARRAFHGMLTALCNDVLLGVKLLSDLEVRVTDSISNNNDVQVLIERVTVSILYLQQLSYTSSLLALHIEWFLHVTSCVYSGTVPVGKSAKGPDDDIEMQEENETGLDCIDQKFDTNFGVTSSYATAVVRWLRLTTLHTYSVIQLTIDHTLSKVGSLEVCLVKAWLPYEDEELQNLEQYLSGKVPAIHTTQFVKEVQKLARESGTADAFKGSFHCEAMLLSLYLMAREGNEHAGVNSNLRSWAGNLFPRLVAVTKACCPVCATLVEVVATELEIGISFTRSDGDFTPCALPPWLPRKFADIVAKRLERQLDTAIDDKLFALDKRWRKDKGSESPNIRPVTAADSNRYWRTITGAFKRSQSPGTRTEETRNAKRTNTD
jgi:hypothetical protein